MYDRDRAQSLRDLNGGRLTRTKSIARALRDGPTGRASPTTDSTAERPYTYKKRESAESMIDSALGRVLLGAEEPSAVGGEDGIRLSATLHGGGGTIKQGAIRHLVVRFELPDGLHLYGEAAPDGMVPTSVTVRGPDGFVVEDPVFPPTETLRLESLGVELPVWSGSVDVVFRCFAVSKLAFEMRAPIETRAKIVVTARYQACDDRSCLLPRTETLALEVPIEPCEVPSISLHAGHGQIESRMDSTKHMMRLMARYAKASPLRFAAGIARQVAWELRGRVGARR